MSPSITTLSDCAGVDDAIDNLKEHVILFAGYDDTEPRYKLDPPASAPTPPETLVRPAAYFALHFLSTISFFLSPLLQTSFTPLCIPVAYFISWFLLSLFTHLHFLPTPHRRPRLIHLLAYALLDRASDHLRDSFADQMHVPFLSESIDTRAQLALLSLCATPMLLWLLFLIQGPRTRWPFSARGLEAFAAWASLAIISIGWAWAFAGPLPVVLTHAGGRIFAWTLLRSILSGAKDLLVVYALRTAGCSVLVLWRDLSLAMGLVHAAEVMVLDRTALFSVLTLPRGIVAYMFDASMWPVLRGLVAPFARIGVLACADVVGGQVAWQFEGAVVTLAMAKEGKEVGGLVAVLAGGVVYAVSAGMGFWIAE